MINIFIKIFIQNANIVIRLSITTPRSVMKIWLLDIKLWQVNHINEKMERWRWAYQTKSCLVLYRNRFKCNRQTKWGKHADLVEFSSQGNFYPSQMEVYNINYIYIDIIINTSLYKYYIKINQLHKSFHPPLKKLVLVIKE